LTGKLKPNLGRYDNPPEWSEIIANYRGSELQAYFKALLEDKLRSTSKPQYVDQLKNMIKGKVGEILKSKDEKKKLLEGEGGGIARVLELDHLFEREVFLFF